MQIMEARTRQPFHKYDCPCCNGPSYVLAQLEGLDAQLREKVEPLGNENPLPPEPEEVELEEEQLDEAIKAFEELFEERDELEGILNAQVVGAIPFDPANEQFEPLYTDYHNAWQWNYDEYWYYNPELDMYIDEEDKDELIIEFLDLLILSIANATNAMILHEITIQAWLTASRSTVINGMTSGWMLGAGGKNTIAPWDIKQLKKIVKNQWSFLQKFGEEIANGELSGAQIIQRIEMYGEAATYGYEEAKAKTHDVKMPEYPADGSQQCHTNCRCHWVLEDDPNDENFVLGTWTLNPRAEHCQDCIENGRNWSPLRLEKGHLEDEDDEDLEVVHLEDEDDDDDEI